MLYRSGLADSLWDKKRAVMTITKAVDDGNFRTFRRALRYFDSKLLGWANPIKSTANFLIETASLWNPLGWYALYTRMAGSTPEMLAILVYLRIKKYIRSKLVESERKPFLDDLKEVFDAAIQRASFSWSDFAKGAFSPSAGYKLKKMRKYLEGNFIPSLEEAWDSADKDLSAFQHTEAYREAQRLVPTN